MDDLACERLQPDMPGRLSRRGLGVIAAGAVVSVVLGDEVDAKKHPGKRKERRRRRRRNPGSGRPPAYRFVTAWGKSGGGPGEFDQPRKVTLDSQGTVYVSDGDNGRVQKFTNTGAFLSSFGTKGTGNGQFDEPCGMAVDNAGNIYVADRDNSRIQKFNSAGAFLTTWGIPGSANGQFNDPFGLALDSENNLYVVDSDNHRIQKFAPA